MADIHTQEQRRYNMSRIRAKNTRPEMIVRSIAHRSGYRFRLHRKDLPGTPDLVFPRHNKIILVHGCFFHMHDCPYGRVTPKTNAEFWLAKRLSNVERDKKNLAALKKQGWEILIIWECMTKPAQVTTLDTLITNFLN